jgi:hypothetical protein
MSTLDRAIEIATAAHAGQTDKGGAAYIEHPLRVMARCIGDDAKIVAVLHDVVEDCPEWSFDRLRAEGFSEAVLAGLDSVTKRDGEDYGAFVLRAGRNPLGREVKLADLADNSDVSRLPAVTEQDLARLEKYRRAIVELNGSGR